MPAWVNDGFAEYAKRMPANFQLELKEIPLEKRTKTSNIPKIIERESEKLLENCKSGNLIIALDVTGQAWNTKKLSENMQTWHDENRSVDLLVGGPDGLSETCLKKSQIKLSLSALTLPHPIIRIIVAEQLYRGWSILQGHPYHRE